MTQILTEEILMEKSSQELTDILYKACIGKLKEAEKAMDDKNYIGVNKFLQDCNDILYRLGAGLNYKAGILADQLESIYNYLADKLIEANFKKDKKVITEVKNIIISISEAWDIAMKKGEGVKVTTRNLMAYEEHLFRANEKFDILE